MSTIRCLDRSAAPAVVSAFLDALLRRDFDAVNRCLAPHVRFRALVPSGIREAMSAEATTDWLRTWFGTTEAFEVLASGIEPFAGRSRIWYRFALQRDGSATVIDQEGFCDATRSGITDLALVCSGFRPAGAPASDQR
jgi:hypothetical protein